MRRFLLLFGIFIVACNSVASAKIREEFIVVENEYIKSAEECFSWQTRSGSLKTIGNHSDLSNDGGLTVPLSVLSKKDLKYFAARAIEKYFDYNLGNQNIEHFVPYYTNTDQSYPFLNVTFRVNRSIKKNTFFIKSAIPLSHVVFTSKETNENLLTFAYDNYYLEPTDYIRDTNYYLIDFGSINPFFQAGKDAKTSDLIVNLHFYDQNPINIDDFKKNTFMKFYSFVKQPQDRPEKHFHYFSLGNKVAFQKSLWKAFFRSPECDKFQRQPTQLTLDLIKKDGAKEDKYWTNENALNLMPWVLIFVIWMCFLRNRLGISKYLFSICLVIATFSAPILTTLTPQAIALFLGNILFSCVWIGLIFEILFLKRLKR